MEHSGAYRHHRHSRTELVHLAEQRVGKDGEDGEEEGAAAAKADRVTHIRSLLTRHEGGRAATDFVSTFFGPEVDYKGEDFAYAQRPGAWGGGGVGGGGGGSADTGRVGERGRCTPPAPCIDPPSRPARAGAAAEGVDALPGLNFDDDDEEEEEERGGRGAGRGGGALPDTLAARANHIMGMRRSPALSDSQEFDLLSKLQGLRTGARR